MSWSYNFGSNPSIDYPRLLIADTDSTHPVFQDEEITAAGTIDNVYFFASSNSSAGQVRSSVGTPSPRRVAATLLDCLAANKARLAAALEVLDIKIDAGKAATALQKQAEYLRTVEAESGVFAVAEQVFNQFGWRERVWKQWLRLWST